MMVDGLNMFEDELEHELVIDFDVYIKLAPTLQITIQIKTKIDNSINQERNIH
jgi:hypothetical protein